MRNGSMDSECARVRSPDQCGRCVSIHAYSNRSGQHNSPCRSCVRVVRTHVPCPGSSHRDASIAYRGRNETYSRIVGVERSSIERQNRTLGLGVWWDWPHSRDETSDYFISTAHLDSCSLLHLERTPQLEVRREDSHGTQRSVAQPLRSAARAALSGLSRDQIYAETRYALEGYCISGLC